MGAVAAVDQIVVAAPEAYLEQVHAAVAAVTLPNRIDLQVVAGGVLRQDSVRVMLECVAATLTGVLVHDAARSLAPSSVGEAVAAALALGHPAVVPVLPVVDTVARVDGDAVLGNVPRSDLRLVQTPQGFRVDVLRRAHAECPPGLEATDDASLVSRLGYPVVTVPGDPRGMKITHPDDFVLARAWLQQELSEASPDERE
jgi:2-C-methyl-D-erythritol 4-phosphate cytidylyltransferase